MAKPLAGEQQCIGRVGAVLHAQELLPLFAACFFFPGAAGLELGLEVGQFTLDIGTFS